MTFQKSFESAFNSNSHHTRTLWWYVLFWTTAAVDYFILTSTLNCWFFNLSNRLTNRPSRRSSLSVCLSKVSVCWCGAIPTTPLPPTSLLLFLLLRQWRQAFPSRSHARRPAFFLLCTQAFCMYEWARERECVWCGVLVLVSVLVGLTRNFVAVRRCCAVFYVVAVMPAAPLLSSIRSARNASNKMEIVAWATHIHKHKRIWAVNLRRSPVRSPLPIVPPHHRPSLSRWQLMLPHRSLHMHWRRLSVGERGRGGGITHSSDPPLDSLPATRGVVWKSKTGNVAFL